ncbi:unnamed protein product [Peronospora belbahrii]|uniref:E3 ubiquitin-protein ligase n=1 Tax=Peronospora belbahrii TaxID=622444 RepID=A0AAU9LDP4_9STRA|nr:unnamed protein product [Peronospora belbahrii]
MGHSQKSEATEHDVAASLSRSTAGKTLYSNVDISSVSQEGNMALEARLMLYFSAHAVSDDELELIAAFLATSRACQRVLTHKLLFSPKIVSFSRLLQFFLRVIMAAHARSHIIYQEHELAQETTVNCSYLQNTMESCVNLEKKESSVGSNEVHISFKLPENFHKCLASQYGSVKRLKCEEVWHGDHMAYRCKTCGLSDSSCMCLACFDPDEHEGHDYRVYRCSSGGCCDCGDPLAWKPDGFCKKHNAQNGKKEQIEDKLITMKMHSEEDVVMQMLVRKSMEFCVETLREVHASCLRPRARENAESFYPRRKLPRTGLLRTAFPPIVKAHVDRLQQTLAWLQMLSMSCLHYRNVISGMFFEKLPAKFQLDAVYTQGTTSALNSSSQQVEKGPVETAPTSGESDDEELEEGAQKHGQMLMLDVFLKAGVLLPVETCDVLGVLYLKLLFDQSFKQMYTCYFVEWYPYFIELYLAASDENNEDGMRNLSRFIDRLFCQLFHSNAQLRELETVFASMRPTFNANESHGTCCRRRQRRKPHCNDGTPAQESDSTPSSCVEWLMVFLLEKLNDLFRSTLRLMTILPQSLIDGTPICSSSINGSSTSTVGIGTVPETPPVLRVVQTVDCGRNVYKKRVYARLCSDLRTLLVHPQTAAKVILGSYRCMSGDECVLNEASVYAQLMKTFELLQHMDLQTRHVHRHVEYESQNWTFAFVANYELKLLLSAFLTGIPACFSREVWQSIRTGESIWNQGAIGVITGSSSLNPLEADTFRSIALARAILQPVRALLAGWARRNGRPEFISDAAESAVTSAGPGEAVNMTEGAIVTQLVKYYEQGTVALGGASAKSFHFPLHHMYAALIHALCGVARPQTLDDWCELLGMGSTDAEKRKDLTFWYSALDHPLRVLLFSREIKAGLWVRNGGVMLQQLVHYHSKHWRYFGLHSDLFLCQLGASLLPHGSFVRFLFQQLPFRICDSYVLGLRSPAVMQSGDVVAKTDQSRELRLELDIVEEALRLLLQLVLAPVKLASASSPETAAVWLLEREIMHWLTLGPFTRSEVIMRTDMKLVEQIKQLPAHEWAELEEEEILTHVLENVGEYDDPVGNSSCLRTTRSGSVLGYGLKMSGSWKLKPDLWSQVSPLFECFTPSEAQQCEQNVRKHFCKIRDDDNVSTTSAVLPMLPRPQLEGACNVDMHGMIAEAMLNSSYMASVLFIIFENYRRNITAELQSERGDCEDQDSSSVTTDETLLLAALHCLYVAVEILPKDIQSKPLQTASVYHDIRTNLNLDGIAECFEEESSLFVKLCTEIPLDPDAHCNGNEAETSGHSLLSLLLFFAEHKRGMEDSYSVLDAQSKVRINGSISDRVSQWDSANTNGDQAKASAKEMMRQRQQYVLEKMRSQQLQFLSCNDGNIMVDEITESNCYDTEANDMEMGTNSDNCDEESESADYCSNEGKATEGSRSDTAAKAKYSSSMDDHSPQTEECSLCRLPCDSRSHESSFGIVGMILPTNMPQKIENGSLLTTRSDICAFVSSRLPSFHVREPGTTDEMCMQLAESVIWSCGHTIHHTCLKSYLMSLWKQKRDPLEMANGEDRLLSERDMEFMCPICRRLSNCLVPCVSLEGLREQALTTEFTKTEFELEEEEETKDDGQDPLDFLQWLDTQMSFRDDSPVVKRRRSRAQSNLHLRRRLLSGSASKTSLSPGSRSSAGSTSSRGEQDFNEQDVSIEREIGAFCHEILLRSVRAQLYLPTLLTGSIRDEGSLELEIQQLSSECGAQTPAWQLLLHCLEVQLRIAAREKTLLQTDAVDSLQLRSMRQLANLTAVAVAFSTPSSLAWTVVEAPTDKQFESVMARLNGLIFGQQVLFEEDDDAYTTKWNGCDQLPTSKVENTTNAALVGTPILCHPQLLTCFAMRIMWRQSITTPNADVATDQLLTEAFFSARILFTAQVLQSLAYLSMQNDHHSSINKGKNKEEVSGMNTKEIREFEGVESLHDASAWISLMLARSRVTESKLVVSRGVKLERNQNDAAMEEQVSVLCLPLAQQMLLLMDAVRPMPPQHNNDSQGNVVSQAPQTVAESCAVCDGLFPSTPTSTEAPSASMLLDKCLQRLHLPPLRLFFHRQMFPSSQRALCQLWGAQLEAKAAVSRQQARSLTLVTGNSPAVVDTFPLQRQMMLLSSQAAAVASAGANYRVFIPLPRVYMDLFIRYNEKPTGVCRQCAQVPQHPGLCLICGEVLCCFSACCETREGGGVGECTQHAQHCGLGLGAFLLLRACTVILFLGQREALCMGKSICGQKRRRGSVSASW